MDHNRLRKLIVPLVLEQLLAVSIGIIDTFMVSRVGASAIAGVSLVDNLNLFVIQVMAAIAAGGIVIISQYVGENNKDKIQICCAQLEILMGAFSGTILLICALFGNSVLKTLFGVIEEDVMQAASIYLKICGFSFVFWGIYTAGAAILRCHEDTKSSMKVSFIMNIMNVILNAFFVLALHMGVKGVAIATLISRATAGLIMMILLHVSMKKWGYAGIKLRLHGFEMKQIISMGIPSGIENGMFHVGKIILASLVATLGTNAIAANSISYQIIEFPNIFGNAVGMALVVIVGQNIGAKNNEGAINDAKYMMKYAYIGDWICKISLFVLAPYAVSAFALPADASRIAILVLRCFVFAALPIWPLSFTMPNALRGAGDVKFTMIVSVISMWFGRVIVSYILVKVFNLGILGVWIGMFVDWYIRGSSYYARFRSKKWLTGAI